MYNEVYDAMWYSAGGRDDPGKKSCFAPITGTSSTFRSRTRVAFFL